MISTLHKYLTRDLIKTAGMAAAAFTLVMTTFAVSEPLRKQGLGGAQVLWLFWYLLPVMLSLTLPVAAVFATTFVYGRFAMDNELTACKASGISALCLLRPAMVMGVVVGVTSLALNNWIAPELVRRGAETVERNIRGLIYQKLRTDQKLQAGDYGAFGSWILHADGADPEHNQLRGVVVVDGDDAENVRYYTASWAYVFFDEADEVTEMTIVAINPTFGDQTGRRMYEMGEFTLGPYELKMPFEERAAFYDWSKLNRILSNPRESAAVERSLKEIHRQLQATYLCKDIRSVIERDRPYVLVDDQGAQYSFRAPRAVDVRGGAELKLTGAEEAPGSDLPVICEISRPGQPPRRRIYCRAANIRMGRVRDRNVVLAELEDVELRQLNAPEAEPSRAEKHSLGMLRMPGRLSDKLTGVTLEKLYNHPEAYPTVETLSRNLRERIRDHIQPRIVAELHGRLAYGFGCILLAPIGGALGLIYRGGHILTAFALCCLPALVLIVLVVMGRQLIVNPEAGAAVGKAAIWSGVALLGAMTGYLYGVVLRR